MIFYSHDKITFYKYYPIFNQRVEYIHISMIIYTKMEILTAYGNNN